MVHLVKCVWLWYYSLHFNQRVSSVFPVVEVDPVHGAEDGRVGGARPGHDQSPGGVVGVPAAPARLGQRRELHPLV